MPSVNLLKEAARQFHICNACRYCEGYCAVFPAMELRREFSAGDLTYLANLCFECRDCFYACQYAPPHEFAVNIPQTLAALRAETYRDYTWPAALAGLFRQNARAVGLITAGSLVVVVLLTLAWAGPAAFAVQVGAGAFYRVVPYLAMVLPALAITLWGVLAFVFGALRFWRETRSDLAGLVNRDAFVRATDDAFRLRYLGGGGVGCTYPDAGFSTVRRRFHHLVFYGFLLDFASTTSAAIFDHVLGWPAPYPLLSLPVVLGTVGGIMLVIGCAGLLSLKWQSDRQPAAAPMLRMDVAFLVVLGLTGLTGLGLLALRETAAMGTLLAVHLGLVAALFITMPYGKFAHVVYRYAALVRHALEQARAAAGHD